MEKIKRQDELDYIWEKRANEYELRDEREEFSPDDIVTFMHKRPLFNTELHEVSFKLDHMINRSIHCPICNPESQHDYGVNFLRKYLREKLELTDDDIEERAIETDDGHVFDFLIYGNVVIHYFDISYFINYIKESDEMIALLAEFTNNDEYDLVPVTYMDIINIEKGKDVVIFPEEMMNK